MTKDELRYLLYTDFYRIKGRDLSDKEYSKLLKGKQVFSQGNKLLFDFRLYKYYATKKAKNKFESLYIRLRRRQWRNRYSKTCERYGVELPVKVEIGKGFIIRHVNGIVIRGETAFGDNCQIFQQVTIGKVHGNESPIIIGNNVSIGAGAKVIGITSIGDHVAIGANAVVTHNVEGHCSVAGVPARVLHGDKTFNWAKTDYMSFEDWKKQRKQ